MRQSIFALLALVTLGCGESTMEPTQVCEPSGGPPYAIAELVESTTTSETIQLVCFTSDPIELRYQIIRVNDVYPITESRYDWAIAPMPRVTIERHESQLRMIVWDVRSESDPGTTGMHVVDPIH